MLAGIAALAAPQDQGEIGHEPGRRHLLQFGHVHGLRRQQALGFGVPGAVWGRSPALQMRVLTKFKPENGEVPDDVPGYSSLALARFLAKLAGARIAMLLGR